MVRLLPLPLLVLTLCLAACGGETRTKPLTRGQAVAKTEVLEVKVIKVYDVVLDALNHDREPGISHYVEIEVLSGTSAGKTLTLPYDEWNVGSPPPAEDSTQVMAPADWVRRPKDGRGRM